MTVGMTYSLYILYYLQCLLIAGSFVRQKSWPNGVFQQSDAHRSSRHRMFQTSGAKITFEGDSTGKVSECLEGRWMSLLIKSRILQFQLFHSVPPILYVLDLVLYYKSKLTTNFSTLRYHPGFPFNLASDKWYSGGFRGEIISCSARPEIAWLAYAWHLWYTIALFKRCISSIRSSIGRVYNEPKKLESRAIPASTEIEDSMERPEFRPTEILHIEARSEPRTDVPHLRMYDCWSIQPTYLNSFLAYFVLMSFVFVRCLR